MIMKKEGILFIAFVILFIFIVSITSAEASIFIGQPLSLYNLGQDFSVTTKLLSAEDFRGFVKLKLICTQEKPIEQLIYFSPLTLTKNQEKQFTVSFQIMNKGICYLEGSLENIRNEVVEQQKTNSFTSSDLINVVLNTNDIYFSPDEELQVSGTAVKANGINADGVADLIIESIGAPVQINQTNQSQWNQTQGNETNQTTLLNPFKTVVSFSVLKGSYNFKFKIPKDMPPGKKKITINIKDIYGNTGAATSEIEIAAIPTEISIEVLGNASVSNNSFMPGDVITIKPTLYDQASQIMFRNVSLKIKNNEKTVLEQLIASGQATIYRFEKNANPGEYLIEASTEKIKAEKKIYILEVKEVKITLEGNTLHIVNVGNVPYHDSIEVSFKINESVEKKIVDINLDVGQETFIKLEAPAGEYEVGVSGTAIHETLKFDGVPLSGGVVAAVELKKGNNIKETLFWIFLILILILITVFIIKKVKNRKKRPFCVEKKEENQLKSSKTATKLGFLEQYEKDNKVIETKSGDIEMMSDKNKRILAQEKILLSSSKDDFNTALKKIFLKNSIRTGVKSIEPTFLFGNKRDITILFLKIGGIEKLETLRKNAPETFEKILNEYFSIIIDKIKSHQGVADIYNDTILIMFNAIQQYSHGISAVKTATEIRDETFKFNESYKAYVDFSISAGIHTGSAIIGSIKEDKILKYFPLEDTTFISKKLQERASSNEILLTDSTFKRIGNSLDVKKVSPLILAQNKAMDIYAIEQMSLRTKYKDYISKFSREYKSSVLASGKNPYTSL